MPPLRRVYTSYPFDQGDLPVPDQPNLGDPGIWFHLTTAPGFVGLPEVDWPTIPTRGSPESRRATFEVDLNLILQAKCELRKKFTDMVIDSTEGDTRPDEDTITRDLIAEPFCRYEDINGDIVTGKTETDKLSIDVYVIRVVEIFVPVVSINPVVLGDITVSNAASGIHRV